MKVLPIIFCSCFFILMTSLADGSDFKIYAPSRVSQALLIAEAKVKEGKLSLKQSGSVDLGFPAGSVTQHPEKPILYVSVSNGEIGKVSGATVILNDQGAVQKVIPFKLKHGAAFLSLDRENKFLLTANYGKGFVDVYSLDQNGILEARVGGLDEGRKNAHCVLPSPDNRFVYIPYVKDSNDLYQYAFDGNSGSLKSLNPKSATPPAATGPRHMVYHPSLSIAYFSNEQGLGVSVYSRSDSGQLKVLQVCEAVEASFDKQGVTASDIVITTDGRFLFAGIRGLKRDFDKIARYKVLADGKVELLGLTPADKIPWALHLSPQGDYLMVSATGGATLTAFKIGDDGDLNKAASLKWGTNLSDIITR